MIIALFNLLGTELKKHFDIIIAGAGIIGSATAWQLIQKYPNKSILVIEKEAMAAAHQTGRNSGVIHAGVYYQPGSLKAKFCRQGLEETISFCHHHAIPYRQCGKLIVATTEAEESRLNALFENCRANNLSPESIDAKRLKSIEPMVTGLSAVYVPHSGITDYIAITNKMLSLSRTKGVEVCYGQGVHAITESSQSVVIETIGLSRQMFKCDYFINCAGVYADALIRQQGLQCNFSILPFRGEYFRLSQRCNEVVSRLIYPVPDPELPFLGVHLTPMIGGYLTVGPNAVIALGKEAYSNKDFKLSELSEMFRYRGTWKLLSKHFGSGIGELRDSISQRGYLKRVNKYCKYIQLSDLLPYRSGIRAQAVDQSGQLLHDFEFVKSPRTLHVGNAPSPAATSAIPIAKSIVDQI